MEVGGDWKYDIFRANGQSERERGGEGRGSDLIDLIADCLSQRESIERSTDN